MVANTARSSEPERTVTLVGAEAPPSYPPQHLTSLLELTGGLTLAAIGYWLLQDRNVADWDNPTPLERFNGKAWRLDNNSLPVNFIGHPFGGGLAHGLARSNHHGLYVAFGYSSLASFLWEFVLEFKEKVSVNDLIVTSTTGLPIGEFFYKLALYHGIIDGPEKPSWHWYQASYGLDAVSSPGEPSYALHRVGAVGRLVSLPGYLGAVSLQRGFYQGELAAFSFDTEASRHGVGLAFHADTLLAGYHWQRMGGTSEQPQGYALTVGISMAYDYLRSDANRYRDFDTAEAAPDPELSYHKPKRAEQYSALHLPGAALDWHVRHRLVKLDLSARVHPSFAGLAAPAFYDWAGANLEEKGKHILHRQGYFYGWGGAASVRGRMSVGPVVLRGQMMYGAYDSQDGLDRHVERITVDVKAEGDVLFYGASLGVQPSGAPFDVGVELGVRRWRSEVGGYESHGHSVSRGFSARLSF